MRIESKVDLRRYEDLMGGEIERIGGREKIEGKIVNNRKKNFKFYKRWKKNNIVEKKVEGEGREN